MKFLTVAFSSKSLRSVFICTSSARRKHDAENIYPFGESLHTQGLTVWEIDILLGNLWAEVNNN